MQQKIAIEYITMMAEVSDIILRILNAILIYLIADSLIFQI